MSISSPTTRHAPQVPERNSLCTVRAGYFLLLLQTLAHLKLDPADIYAPARLTEVSKVDPNAFRPVEEWDEMVAQAEDHANGIDIAVKMAEFIKPWDTGAIGFITMACRTLREATVALGQFFSLLNDVYKLDGGTNEDQFQVVMIPQGAVRSIYLERLTLSIIVWHARWLSKRPDLVFDVAFTFDAPDPERVLVYQRTFGGQVSFGNAQGCLSGPATYADYPVASGPNSDQVHDILRNQLMAEMELLHQSSSGFMHRVEYILQSRLESGQTGLEDVAGELGVSSRTLQNRLEESGLSYRALLDRMRHAQALVYVSDPTLNLIQAAQMLGFATQSTFQRAFKRWTGMTPGDYRRRR